MGVDASAVARVLGIETKFKDLRQGSILYLPMMIAVIAQGSSDAVYSTEKFQGTSAAQVGAIAGYGSPAHACALELFPPNGDGVGSIPVWFYLLDDDASGVAAVKTVTPSGTQSAQASYRVRVNNIDSEQFVLPVGALSVTDTCRKIGEAVNAVLRMPVKAIYAYGTVTSTPGTNTGTGTCTALSAPGSPVPGAHMLRCTQAVANGGVWSLYDPDGTLISSSITMTPGPNGATVINVGGLQFTLTDATTDFAVDDSFTIAVPATLVSLPAKWKGDSSNAITIEVVGDALGATFTIASTIAGAVNPSIDDALAQLGNVWQPLVLNALDIDDTGALTALATTGEGRWGTLVRKPFVAFTGNTKSAVGDAIAVSSARRTDRINAQLVSPGSKDLPHVVAARQLARIAVMANNNPPTDYGMLKATGLTPGPDSVQWDYPKRDQAVKNGSSTVEVIDGVVNIGDAVTFYRPAGEEPPAYRYVVDIIKVMNILYNIDLVFSAPEWASAPLIPDGQATVNPNAKQPHQAIAAAAGVIDGLALQAIINDPKGAKKALHASISSSNPKRLDMGGTFQISGNTNVKSFELNWGFFFGAAAA